MRGRVVGALAVFLLGSLMIRAAKFNDLLLIAWVGLVLGFAALWLYDRRLREAAHEIRFDSRHTDWRRIARGVKWPVEHKPCGQVAYSWGAVSRHLCPHDAPQGPLPGPEVVPVPSSRGGGAGSVDTMSDEPPGARQVDLPHGGGAPALEGADDGRS